MEKKMSFADFLKAEGFTKESFEEKADAEAKTWVSEMEAKTITISGLDFNKAVAEVTANLMLEEGAIKATTFMHGAYFLAATLFGKGEK